jgi:Fe2+ or Zn2+ uptake regulation protein
MNEITKQIHAQRGTPGETFKTDHFTDDQHEKTKVNANKQEAAILTLLEKYSYGLGATVIQMRISYQQGQGFLVTSIRRALTSLAKQGKVEKLAEMELSRYGRNEHLWRLKRD